jgi:hypothetical protein
MHATAAMGASHSPSTRPTHTPHRKMYTSKMSCVELSVAGASASTGDSSPRSLGFQVMM